MVWPCLSFSKNLLYQTSKIKYTYKDLCIFNNEVKQVKYDKFKS